MSKTRRCLCWSVACLQGHNAALRHGQILDDGRRLIVASGDRQISTWDLTTEAQIATLPSVMGSRVKSLAISGDGRTAVVVLFDSSIGVWDLTEGTCRCMLQKRGARVPGAGHMGGVNAVYLTADGQLAVTVSKVRRSHSRKVSNCGGSARGSLKGDQASS